MNTTLLKALQIKAKHQVYTYLSGNNLSKMFAQGYDFAQLREYQQGDDIRKINWSITAKLQKPYIKELHANKELSVVVATLMDATLYFGKDNKKQKTITEVATLLGYAIQQNNDLFRGIIYTQNQTYMTPPTKQLYHIEEFSKHLYTTPLLETTLNQQKAVNSLFTHIHKPSLVFVIGDFLTPIDLSILAQKHEVIAIEVREKNEENPKNLGEVILQNPQNNQTLDTYFGKRNIQTYKKRLLEHDEKLESHFLKYGIRHSKVYTNDEVIGKLVKLFS